LVVDDADALVLAALGGHLGSLAGADLARRCAAGRLDPKAVAVSRRDRKQALTGACSSRWAGAITRTSEDAWGLGERNLVSEARSLRARIGRIGRRLDVGVGDRRGKTRGYASQAERFAKQAQRQALRCRLATVEADLGSGRVAVCRGRRAVARSRHHLDQAGIDEPGWRRRWEASRWFLTADGEAGKAWGNAWGQAHHVALGGSGPFDPVAHLGGTPSWARI
jgi:hypothetical protein